jgi:3-methyladenine DNA glycosylase AlkD
VDVAALVERLDGELRALGTPERAEQERRYLKSDLTHYGVTVPAIHRLARAASRDPGLDVRALVDLARRLWAAPVHERRALAADLLALRVDLLEPADAAMLEEMIRRSKTWALVDALAPSVMGPLVERHPRLGEVLDRWAADPDVWVRRAALLAHLIPLRTGGGDWERFARHADTMLEEREFFIRKAIGWVLRDTSRKRPDLVSDWLRPRIRRASGVTVREAVRHLPPADRESLLAARRPQAKPPC